MFELMDKLEAVKKELYGRERLENKEYQESASELRKRLREYVTQLCGGITFLDEKELAGIAAYKIFKRMANDWETAESYRAAPGDWGRNEGAAIADKLQADVMQNFRLARLLLRVSEFGYGMAV